jgi:uncharacterized protein (DUF1800 family)
MNNDNSPALSLPFLLLVLFGIIPSIGTAAVEKVLLTQIQTLNNSANLNKPSTPWLTVAVNHLNANGVDVALERAESAAGKVTTAEQIGYVAFSVNHNTRFIDSQGSTILFETRQISVAGWGNSCSSVDLSSNLTNAALLIASQSSRNGGDGGWVRRCNTNQSLFGLAIDEDTSRDSERKHAKEQVSLIGFSKAFKTQFGSGAQRWQMEAGQLGAPSTVNHASFTHIQFQQQYGVPPVVIVLPGTEGALPVSVRIKNVTRTGFDLRLVEPAGSDDKHLAQIVHYLALTPGVHSLPDGAVIEAGAINTKAVQFGRGVSGKRSWSHIQFQKSQNQPPQQGKLNAADAARFLTQASFGPTDESIDQLVNAESYQVWLQQQMALPTSYQLEATQDYWLKVCPLNEQGQLINSPSEIADTWEASMGRHNVWWQSVLRGDDQLRQRVAFALSQIFVVSDKPQMLEDSQFGMASYYDTLLKHAFGNYRDLLEDVTLHPVMGIYLGMLRNQKADLEHNIRPDENYAREVLQLFSIGVHQLNIDGTLKLENGQPIPTYNQSTIQEFARVFTGWNYADVDWLEWIGNGNRMLPMMPVEQFHDRNKKQLLNGLELPAKHNARADLNAALDNIFNHPNVGPFISKLLIQRLITSNPTPNYVARVATVFNDNGSGIRGDLAAVISAILLDDEALNGHKTLPAFGKLKEPLLRLTHVYRAFDLQPNIQQGSFWEHELCGRNQYPVYVIGDSWTHLAGLDKEIGQAALRSPSVFNFYRPDYSPAGISSGEGLIAPEFQLASENFVVNTANLINYSLFWAEPVSGVNNAGYSWLDLSQVATLANNSDDLLNALNRVLLNGSMSGQLRAIIKQHLTDPQFQYHDDIELDKTRDAIALILISPEYLIQK